MTFMKKETPVLLLTGYLGSGKTTLVNHILNNRQGIRFAVIVNDIGEVNIDADLIQKGGVVGKKDESLVALQNGCICCTLKMDLIEQLDGIQKMGRFDYIVIEASGICEPEPIARTICSIPQMGQGYTKNGVARLDCIVTVVDALRMQSEFGCGEDLTKENIDEEDIENLVIQQIEFCNIVVLNKVSDVTPGQREKIRQIIRHLQPEAKIIETDWARVHLDSILNTGMFSYEQVSGSAGWIHELERQATDEEEEEARAEHSHGHHHDGEGEVEEYGIGTFVYYRRRPFDINKFDSFVARKWPKNVIRAKGICYFADQKNMSYLFEQAGVQKQIKEAGLWYAAAPENELIELMVQDPGFMRDWDEQYGDRMIKIVFIGQHLDRESLTADLDFCLDELR